MLCCFPLPLLPSVCSDWRFPIFLNYNLTSQPLVDLWANVAFLDSWWDWFHFLIEMNKTEIDITAMSGCFEWKGHLINKPENVIHFINIFIFNHILWTFSVEFLINASSIYMHTYTHCNFSLFSFFAFCYASHECNF